MSSTLQTIGGISVAAGNSTAGRLSLQATIAGVASLPSNVVAIMSVSSALNGAVSLSPEISSPFQKLYNDKVHHRNDERGLAGSGIVVKYTITVTNGHYTVLSSQISAAVTSGTFTSTLRSNGGASFADATASTQPALTDYSPSSAPSRMPSTKPTMLGSSSGSSFGPSPGSSHGSSFGP